MHTAKRKSGFTLVELLVVIGIIAALIGILLPVLSKVQSRGRDVQCQSNIRQCLQLFVTYATENKGSLPFGLYYTHGDPVSWAPVGGDEHLITIWSVLSRMSSKAYSGEDLFAASTSDPNNPEAKRSAAPFLRCPEAMLVYGDTLCTYAGNFVAFLAPYDDFQQILPGIPLLTKPTKITQCLPFTILMWDTNVQPGMATDVGYVTGADIDGQRFWQGAGIPQYRFYSESDPFGQLPPPATYGNNRPVRLDVGSSLWYNIDPPPTSSDGFNSYPYQGSLRFRHGRDTTCNVGYSDGHVAQLTGKFNAQGRPISYDALRKYFMVRWPSGSGIGPNTSFPY